MHNVSFTTALENYGVFKYFGTNAYTSKLHQMCLETKCSCLYSEQPPVILPFFFLLCLFQFELKPTTNNRHVMQFIYLPSSEKIKEKVILRTRIWNDPKITAYIVFRNR